VESDAVAVTHRQQMAESEPHALTLAVLTRDQTAVLEPPEHLARMRPVEPHDGRLLGQFGEELQGSPIVCLVGAVERHYDSAQVVDVLELVDDLRQRLAVHLGGEARQQQRHPPPLGGTL
jgi:hypothetical protein